MAAPASKTRQEYTLEVELEMKLRRRDPDAIERRCHVWKEYEKSHPERTWQNYDSHFRKQMITRLADYVLNKEDMIRVLQKCNVKLDEWQRQRKALERGLNCKLFVDLDGTVLSCLPLKDHAEEDGATTSADDGSDTEDAQDDSDSSGGPAAEAQEANDVEGPDNVDLLERTDDDEELSLCLSEEEPEEIGGSQPANSDAAAPLGVQSEQVESGQESQNEKGAAVSAIQAGRSSSAPTPDSSSSVALPVIQPGMSYEEQKRICHKRMKLVLEKKQQPSTFLEGVAEPLRSELVGMFRAVLKAEGFNYDPDPTETDWLSSLHPPPRKLPREAKKSS